MPLLGIGKEILPDVQSIYMNEPLAHIFLRPRAGLSLDPYNKSYQSAGPPAYHSGRSDFILPGLFIFFVL